MSDAFLTTQGIEWGGLGGQVGVVSYGDRSNCEFYRASVRNGNAAIASGDAAFVGVDMIRIWQAGERNLWAPTCEVLDYHKRRFPAQWAAYQEGRKQIPDGIPVATLYPNEPDMADRLRMVSIHTIEQLAELQETGIAKLGMGAREMVLKAKQFMETAGDSARTAAMIADRDRQDATIAELQAQVTRLLAKEGALA
jgi:hypothetical protein